MIFCTNIQTTRLLYFRMQKFHVNIIMSSSSEIVQSGASICGEDWEAQTPFFDPPFLLRFPSPPFPHLPLEVGCLKCSQGSGDRGERCKLPQRRSAV